jgi:hypothetical protein
MALADGNPAGDDEGFGQAGRLGGTGAGAAQPGPGLGRDGAGDGAGQDTPGQDVGDRTVEPQGNALPGQRRLPRSPCASLTLSGWRARIAPRCRPPGGVAVVFGGLQ